LYIGQRFVAGSTLADTAGDGRTFRNPNAIFIPIEFNRGLHGLHCTPFLSFLEIPPSIQSQLSDIFAE